MNSRGRATPTCASKGTHALKKNTQGYSRSGKRALTTKGYHVAMRVRLMRRAPATIAAGHKILQWAQVRSSWVVDRTRGPVRFSGAKKLASVNGTRSPSFTCDNLISKCQPNKTPKPGVIIHAAAFQFRS